MLAPEKQAPVLLQLTLQAAQPVVGEELVAEHGNKVREAHTNLLQSLNSDVNEV